MTSSIKIPVSVIVVTKNEAKNLPRCLAALERFDEVVVVDSESRDGSKEIVESFGAAFMEFAWDGLYPKKRQWCLDSLSLKHDRVFFVDADEEATPHLCDEIAGLNWKNGGYYVRAKYVSGGKTLCYGMDCEKLSLFDRRLCAFPVVDDLGIEGMGEIEGHYQPVLKYGARAGKLASFLLHHALDDEARHAARHDGYARWREGISSQHASIVETRLLRRVLRRLYKAVPCKRLAFFLYFYFWKLGVIEAAHNREIYRQKRRYLGL